MDINVQEMKKQTFKQQSIEDWEKAAKKSLKNKTLQSLKRTTYEGITLSPLYTKESIKTLHSENVPGKAPFTRGFEPRGYIKEPWGIAQQLKSKHWDSLVKLLFDSVKRGQNTISFCMDELEDIEQLDFNIIAENIQLKEVPVCLITKKYFSNVIESISSLEDRKQLHGIIGTDIVSATIHEEKMINTSSEMYQQWQANVEKAATIAPNVKMILIDTTPYHNGGAHAIQELAIALAEAVFYIEAMKEKGWEPEKTVNKMAFHFAISGNFFMEIAKFRAFRTLWSTICSAYEIAENKRKVVISAETSQFTNRIDPYVNMLRAGNEAFAGILGGIDFLHVSPYDQISENSNEFSNRIARNTQLILKEESLLNKVVDPAGGSYYIESITAELINRTWSLFQTIEEKGGIIDVLNTHWLQQEIAKVMDKRHHDIITRNKSIIGTNIYVNLQDEPLPVEDKAIGIQRQSAPFESLRERAQLLTEKGIKPEAGFICLDKIKDHKPRADFATNFLAAGGIEAVWSGECLSLEDVKEFIEKGNFSYYCICGTDEAYEQHVDAIAHLFQKEYANVSLDIAGNPTPEKLASWQSKGVTGLIHKKQNMYEKLASLLEKWEEEINE